MKLKIDELVIKVQEIVFALGKKFLTVDIIKLEIYIVSFSTFGTPCAEK